MTIVAPDLTGCQVRSPPGHAPLSSAASWREVRPRMRIICTVNLTPRPPSPHALHSRPCSTQLKPYVAARATPQGKRVPDWEAILKNNTNGAGSKETELR